jgi:hypothetical protein
MSAWSDVLLGAIILLSNGRFSMPWGNPEVEKIIACLGRRSETIQQEFGRLESKTSGNFLRLGLKKELIGWRAFYEFYIGPGDTCNEIYIAFYDFDKLVGSLKIKKFEELKDKLTLECKRRNFFKRDLEKFNKLSRLFVKRFGVPHKIADYSVNQILERGTLFNSPGEHVCRELEWRTASIRINLALGIDGCHLLLRIA